MSLGILIRSLRKEAGLSQEAVAQQSGLSVRTYRSLESGEVVDPHFSTLVAIANVLGMSIGEFPCEVKEDKDAE